MTKKNKSAQSPEEQLQKLSLKHYKAKAKLQQATAKELSIRMEIDAILAKKGDDLAKVTLGHNTIKAVNDVAITFTRKKNYSVPKAAIVDIKTTIDDDATFNSLFTTSYKLKEAPYNNLKGTDKKTKKIKKAIDSHLTIKNSPLSAIIKEVE